MKLSKKVCVYGVILVSSLGLLASQALVTKPVPKIPNASPRRDASASPSAASTPAPTPPVQRIQTNESSSVADARVERLENSLSALQALLPADRSAELDAIGRAWNTEAAPPVAPPAQVNVTPASASAPIETARTTDTSSKSASSPESNAKPTLDPLADWLAKNPLTAIAVGPTRSLAAFGGELFSAGDLLPENLGSVTHIDVRWVVITHLGTARRVPIAPLAARAADPAPAAPAPSSPTTPAPAPANGIASPDANASALQNLLKQLSAPSNPASDGEKTKSVQPTGNENAHQNP